MYALIFAATLAAYWPALQGGFIWDDLGHVTRPDLRPWSGLLRIWGEIGATQQYYPFLHTAFWLEHRLWGDSPLGYHLLNIFLHATAACLFGVVLRRLLESASEPSGSRFPGVEWLAALLFALHPVGVESVAWISEQKNTLSTVLYLCAALVYLRFDGDRRAGSYALATGLFVLALLTKTVTATLPAALLVIFWWRRGHLSWRRDVLPLLPWFAFSAAAGLITSWVEGSLLGAHGADFSLGLIGRSLLAGRVIWFYLGKLIWPANLIFIYPHWTVDPGAAWQYLFPLGVAAVIVALWFQRRKNRGPLAAVLFFVGSLFPALGFINVFPFIFSYVADHFQYLASLGIFALAAAGLAMIAARIPAAAGRGFAGALLFLLGALTWQQSKMYHDVFTLYQTTIDRNPACWMAENNLAESLAGVGRVPDAIPHLERAIALRPQSAEAENNFGDDLRQLGRPLEAIPHLERALKLQPTFAQAHNNLGVALMEANRPAEGLTHFEEALRLNPHYAQACFNLGLALANTGHPPEAIEHFARAVQLDPSYGEAELNWAIGLTITGQFPAARPHFERALQLEPNSSDAHNMFGHALEEAGHSSEANEQYHEAARLKSGNPP
jgi:protein O-mannosyl-transferase